MRLRGVFSPPGDKSISHRIALISQVARGECVVSNLAPGADVRSSLEAVRLLGTEVRYEGDRVVIRSSGMHPGRGEARPPANGAGEFPCPDPGNNGSRECDRPVLPGRQSSFLAATSGSRPVSGVLGDGGPGERTSCKKSLPPEGAVPGESTLRIDCGNSGTTMRLLMGILAGQAGEFVLDGDESLRRRPMERIAAPLRLMGAEITTESGRCPVTVSGTGLRGIAYELPMASAQLKSAILLAGLQADGRTVVREKTPSRDHTERLVALCRGKIRTAGNEVEVERSELSLPESLYVPGDPSSAAFFLCAAAIVPGSEVIAQRVLLNPTRTGFVGVLQRMGADIDIEVQGDEPEPWGTVTVRYSPDLTGCEVLPEEIPSLVDEVPILALVATQARGATVFRGVSELRVKESDRLAAVSSQLGAMGAKMSGDESTLVVEGPVELQPVGALDSFGDHRIAMTLRLAGLLIDSRPTIQGEESVVISYPGFHETLERLVQ
ncbi:MAG: 3-phosphoshikimate 1-carboxyvinyltransferase [Thermodesulfobacteriota bacterium]